MEQESSHSDTFDDISSEPQHVRDALFKFIAKAMVHLETKRCAEETTVKTTPMTKAMVAEAKAIFRKTALEPNFAEEPECELIKRWPRRRIRGKIARVVCYEGEYYLSPHYPSIFGPLLEDSALEYRENEIEFIVTTKKRFLDPQQHIHFNKWDDRQTAECMARMENEGLLAHYESRLPGVIQPIPRTMHSCYKIHAYLRATNQINRVSSKSSSKDSISELDQKLEAEKCSRASRSAFYLDETIESVARGIERDGAYRLSPLRLWPRKKIHGKTAACFRPEKPFLSPYLRPCLALRLESAHAYCYEESDIDWCPKTRPNKRFVLPHKLVDFTERVNRNIVTLMTTGSVKNDLTTPDFRQIA